MARHSDFWKMVKRHPYRFYIIHYSSQSLFDAEAMEGAGALSPRITSVVVRHLESGQTVSFATHTVVEYLGIPWDEIEARYDEIEGELLTQFYDWARDRLRSTGFTGICETSRSGSSILSIGIAFSQRESHQVFQSKYGLT